MDYKNELPRNICAEVENISRHIERHPLTSRSDYLDRKGNFAPVVNDIVWVAKSDCLYTTDQKVSNHVLEIAAADLVQAKAVERELVSKAISDSLPFTYVPVPRALRKFNVYPTPAHRRADEIRDMFKKPSKVDELREHAVNFFKDKAADIQEGSRLFRAVSKLNAVALEQF